uniref:Uncharacterized protein n=1 Tax=Salmonella sp. TaxID=599 RepID=A0A482ETC8_SALSP|nr:hypothetical protein [Salmonella sp.]QBM91361.1 hypothetical protein NNIBIDOC_00028 [Salmonella sp.]
MAYGKNIVAAAAMRIRYARWQWTVEVDGLNGFDMFVKDVTYTAVGTSDKKAGDRQRNSISQPMLAPDRSL